MTAADHLAKAICRVSPCYRASVARSGDSVVVGGGGSATSFGTLYVVAVGVLPEDN